MRSALFASFVVACGLCCSCAPLPYAEVEQWNRPAFYVGAGALLAAEDFDDDDTPGIDYDDSVGAEARVGYRFD